MSSCFRFLSIRQRSRKEIEAYIQKKSAAKEISSDIVETVLTRLEELDYVNDRSFAKSFITSALLGKPKGPNTIRFELKRKGISEEIIQEMVSSTEEIQSEEIQLELAHKSLGRKGEQYQKLPLLECKRKVHDYLMRKGFANSIIHRLVDDLCQKAYNKSHEIS